MQQQLQWHFTNCSIPVVTGRETLHTGGKGTGDRHVLIPVCRKQETREVNLTVRSSLYHNKCKLTWCSAAADRWEYLQHISTSPQSNLRRARRSSADKTSTWIANYWDRTALAYCRHSSFKTSRAESKDSGRLGLACALYAVPLQKWLPPTALLLPPNRHVVFVLLRFCTLISLQPPLRSWTYVYHKKANRTQNSTIYST